MRTLRRVGLHLLVAVAVTFPLVLHLASAIPLGIEPTGTVPLFNLWTLRWNQLELGHLYQGYWDAPIFHPTAGTFAFSDPQPLTGAVFAPLSWLSTNPTLAYNLVVLAVFTLNGLAAARLARRVGAAEWPAVLAGVMAQGLPFVINQLGVLQLTVLFPLFFLLDAVVAWATTDERAAGPAIGIWLSVTFLTSSYYGLFAVVVVPVAALVLLSRRCFDRRHVLGLLAGVGVFAVTALPVLVAQKHYTDPFRRADQEIDALSAQPVDYLHLQPDRVGISVVPFLRSEGGSAHALYPGTVLLLLGVAGAVLGVRSGRERDEPTDDGRAASDGVATSRTTGRVAKRTTAFLGLGALTALLLSFGLHLGVGSLGIYDLVRTLVPGYASLRSPFRLAALVQVFLVPLAAMTLDRMWRRPDDGGRIIAAGLVLFALLEVALPPVRLVDVPEPATDWAAYLATQPGAEPVAIVPFPNTGAAESYEPTTEWMLSALDQPHPLVNGYSGIFPPQYDELEQLMRSFPARGSIEALRERGVRFVVVQHDQLSPETQRLIVETEALHPAFRGTTSTVYALV